MDHNIHTYILFICKAYQVFSSPVFSQMMISFFYGGKLMQNILVSHPEGCRISPQQHLGRGTLYSSDSMQSVHFPPFELIEFERQRQVTRKLLGHLERGVLVRANQEGIFIKRLCQSRVFWSGLGHSQYSPMPCKLERDAVVKIFDTGRFLQGKVICLFSYLKSNKNLNQSTMQIFFAIHHPLSLLCIHLHISTYQYISKLQRSVWTAVHGLCVLQLCSCTRRDSFLLLIQQSHSVLERSSKISAMQRTNWSLCRWGQVKRSVLAIYKNSHLCANNTFFSA